MARLDSTGAEVIPGDTVRASVIVRNGHDAGTALSGTMIVGRIVCTNGLMRDVQRARLFTLRHTRNVRNRLVWAREVIGEASRRMTEDVVAFQAMARKRAQTADVIDYLRTLFPDPKEVEKERAKRNAEKIRDEVMDLLERGRGTEIPGVKGTVWGVYNAVTEWVDHHRHAGHDSDKRLESNWFGSGAEIKGEAYVQALRML